jgi:hypothetical protein
MHRRRRQSIQSQSFHPARVRRVPAARPTLGVTVMSELKKLVCALTCFEVPLPEFSNQSPILSHESETFQDRRAEGFRSR